MAAIQNLFERANEATKINNSDGADFRLTTHGSDWLWAVFSVFTLLLLIHATTYVFASNAKHTAKKFFYVSPIFISFVFSFAYFTYASNLGWAGKEAEFNHVTTSDESETPGVRQVFYAKFIAWFLGLPFVLFTLEFARVANGFDFTTWDDTFLLFSNLILQIIAFESFVVSLLVGILIHSTYKWGYFTFGTVALLFGIYTIITDHYFSSTTTIRSNLFKIALIPFIIVLLILYPVAWGLSEGGNVIQPDSEAVFYGILDLFLYGCVPATLIFFIPSYFDGEISLRGRNTVQEPTKEIAEEPRASGDTAVSATEGENAGVINSGNDEGEIV